MASKTSIKGPKATSLEAFGRDVERRRKAAKAKDMPRNAGGNRTKSKKALLAAIKATGATW